MTEELFNDIREGMDTAIATPPPSLTPSAHYERMASIFNDTGYFCTSVHQLKDAVAEAFRNKDKPSLINVMINPMADRKPQNFAWLTRSKM